MNKRRMNEPVRVETSELLVTIMQISTTTTYTMYNKERNDIRHTEWIKRKKRIPGAREIQVKGEHISKSQVIATPLSWRECKRKEDGKTNRNMNGKRPHETQRKGKKQDPDSSDKNRKQKERKREGENEES